MRASPEELSKPAEAFRTTGGGAWVVAKVFIYLFIFCCYSEPLI